MKVPLLDLGAQIKRLRPEIIKAIEEVIDSNQYILGPKVAALEEAISDYVGCRYAIGTSSGTDALLSSLMALGIGHQDLVITSVYSFFSTASVIVRLSARPIFIDIDPVTYNIDTKRLEDWFEKNREEVRKVRAIIPVHLYGQCADMGPILDISRRYNIPVIEDAAQALGAEYRLEDRVFKAGSMGNVGCFSFFPSKNLGAMGDGGMAVTNDKELADRLRIIRVHGARPKYFHSLIGGNFRLDSIQAAILLVKLPYLERWHKERRKNAERYEILFKNTKLLERQLIKLPKVVYKDLKNGHIFNQYIIRAKRRDELREFLKERGIGTAIYYPLPFHLQPCFRYLGYKKGDFPEAERAAEETLALPIYPELTEEMQVYIVEKIEEFYERAGNSIS